MSAKSRHQAPPAATPVEAPIAAPVPAGLMVRLFAMVYDGLLLIALWAVSGAVLVIFNTDSTAARQHEIQPLSAGFQQYVLFPTLVGVTWLFYGYFWTRIGQTLGMQTWRLKVLRADGQRLRWRDAFARCAAACLFPLLCALVAQLAWHSSAAPALSLLLGFLGNYLWMLWSPRRLAWHDQLSATLVWRLPPEPRKKRRFFGWFAERGD